MTIRNKRIYHVREDGNDKPKLIWATSPAQAIRHAAASVFRASVATQEEIVSAMGLGVSVETAGDGATTGDLFAAGGGEQP